LRGREEGDRQSGGREREDEATNLNNRKVLIMFSFQMFNITIFETNIKCHGHRHLSGVQETHLIDSTDCNIL
jgi:hypothetical protein